MPEVVVITDTSCLIVLSKINLLDLLPKLYASVFVTEEISAEFGEPLPDWVQIRSAANKNCQRALETLLDKGEASALALAFELPNAMLILDDLKARREAKKLGFRMTGTLGVLFAARQRGAIEKLEPYLKQLQEIGFYIAPAIMEMLLRNKS